jgi:hypothetical protein
VTTDLRYPIGRPTIRSGLTADERAAVIDDIAALPGDLRAVIGSLSAAQLDTPYRPGGWSIRQVVHHLPDSHVNAYIRFKLAATEDEPRITAYDQPAWAECPDGRGPDIETSLVLLESLHRRWVTFLRSLRDEDFQRSYIHPLDGRVTLESALQHYAWHGRHHLAHTMMMQE